MATARNLTGMYRWKVWFRTPPRSEGLPQLVTAQCHGFRRTGWRVADGGEALWQILAVVKGALRRPTGDGWLMPGDLLLMPPSRPRDAGAGQADDPAADFLYLRFHPGPLTALCERLVAERSLVHTDLGQQPMLGLLAWQSVYRRMVAANRLRVGATPVIDVEPGLGLRTLGGLLALFTDAQETRPRDAWIERALELHSTARRPDLTATAWARLIGCSRKHLTARFRAAGLPPPATWLARWRVAEADKLLAEGVRAGEIARRLGFADAGSLARARRRWTTPG